VLSSSSEHWGAEALTPLERYFESRGSSWCQPLPGLRLPHRFTHPQEEHLATRRSAGIFDFSFMACIELSGPGSRAFLHRLQTRNLSHLKRGRIAYTLLLRHDGTVLNDATVWCFDDGHYALFTGRRSDLSHIRRVAADFDVVLDNRSDAHAVIAVQGPLASRIVSSVIDQPAPDLPYFGFWSTEFGGKACWIARMGYSGESGFELLVPAAEGPALWQALRRKGGGLDVLECGFAAMNSLRIEAGHLLFSNELALEVTPYELGFTRLVDLYPHDFIGISRLRQQRWAVPDRRLVGLLPAVPADPGFGTPPSHANPEKAEGILTSACYSPLLRRWIGMGYVNSTLVPEGHRPGTRLLLSNGITAIVARLPFYDPGRRIPRSAD